MNAKQKKALLQKKVDEYVGSMERQGAGLNYDRLPTDVLLIVEALNDWSAGTLAEGGSVKLSVGDSDPACATSEELVDLINRVHRPLPVLYPVSGFSFGDDDESLKFSYAPATYRIQPHKDGSRFSGVAVAEVKHIADADIAMQLWLACATEDCMAYLFNQAHLHGLYPDEDSQEDTRRIISGNLQKRFSVGQIWNATWRAVRDAAALSKRQYWNSDKAAKQLPKKIDKVLLDAAADLTSFIPYERLGLLPPGAVLTLFRARFGVDDTVPGEIVREKLTADAALSPPTPSKDADEDAAPVATNTAHLVRGVIYFNKSVTDFDRQILSCFRGIKLETTDPEWLGDQALGKLEYTMEDYYAFQGRSFAGYLFEYLGAAPPSAEEIQEQSVAAQKHAHETGAWVDKSGHEWALEKALARAGLPQEVIRGLTSTIVFPAGLDDVLETLSRLPGASGMVGARVNSMSIYEDYSEKSDAIYADGLSVRMTSDSFEPTGSDDQLVNAAVSGDLDGIAELVASAVYGSVYVRGAEKRDQLLAQIGRRLVVMASRSSSEASND